MQANVKMGQCFDGERVRLVVDGDDGGDDLRSNGVELVFLERGEAMFIRRVQFQQFGR
jgi:hypothetical protein